MPPVVRGALPAVPGMAVSALFLPGLAVSFLPGPAAPPPDPIGLALLGPMVSHRTHTVLPPVLPTPARPGLEHLAEEFTPPAVPSYPASMNASRK